jgi:ElaB/YqjD/DUF883 family membrane-anchored ribosome-binding protein
MEQERPGGEPAGGTTPPSAGTAGARSRAEKAKEYVEQQYGVASDAMKNTYTQVRGKVDEFDFTGAGDQVRNFVRSNPGKALLISVGIGFVIGLMMRGSGDDD